MVTVRTFELPEPRYSEVCRYAGADPDAPSSRQAVERVTEICRGFIRAATCSIRLPVTLRDGGADFPFGRVDSRALTRNLAGCREVVLFAATVGLGIDRLVERYRVRELTTSVFINALGSERVECLCRLFCRETEEAERAAGRFTRPRFSPGYGDFPLALQRPVLTFLDAERKIGITLNESLLMSPSKSVTAIVGVGEERCRAALGCCSFCDREDCPERKAPPAGEN